MSRIVCLSGGVGGARFVRGLARALPPGDLSVIVNTGDDFVHWGLDVSPDLDTVMYTLAGLISQERGWGLEGETFRAKDAIARLGGPAWFGLGDADLAVHLTRTEALRNGETLSAVTDRLRRALGVASRLVPMSDQRVRTLIETKEHGTLSFQDWFVRLRTEPPATSVRFDACPLPAPDVIPLIEGAELLLAGPSNPYVSIDPILALPGVREAVAKKRFVAVSPIVAGQAIKGPLATMIRDLAHLEPSPGAIAAHYGSLLAGLVVERGDEATVPAVPVLGTSTVMRTAEDSERLAHEVLDFAAKALR
jgi:LPPG:FO 2-phospho-L-lactate transferase